MTPLKVGAALNTENLPKYRDWLFEMDRDLEIQDFFSSKVLLGDWKSVVDTANKHLDGFQGRLGIHGPFVGFTLDNDDPEFMPIIQKRLMIALEACEALGATQMVMHSPFTTWDTYNFGNNPAVGNKPSARDYKIERTGRVLEPIVARAREIGATLVVENIEDIDPNDQKALATYLGSDTVKLSIDTGHAHYAYGSTGAPPVHYYVLAAGDQLDHVHIQDADGHADRHWAPGQGTINWHALFRALASLPVSPRLVLELHDHDDIPIGIKYLEDQGLAARA